MKKHLLIAVLLIAVSISAKAQFSLGIKGGINYSTINSDNLKSSSVAGYQAGLFARIGGGLYLQPEVYLSSSGGSFSSNDNTYSGKVTFTNLNVPVLVGLRFGPKNLNLRAMAGPEYIAVLNQNKNLSSNFNAAYNNFGNAYKNNMLGYQAGVGIDLGAITADLRYQGDFDHFNNYYNQRQNLWALSVGFKFF
ncbi:MAG: PorT family protein [Mucilaginibacter sp.]|nr:PorT family protein [Mucilaginibacter sp.]